MDTTGCVRASCDRVYAIPNTALNARDDSQSEGADTVSAAAAGNTIHPPRPVHPPFLPKSRRNPLALNDIVLGSVRELGDVVAARLGDDEDVVFAIPPGTGRAFGYHDHGFHGDDHPWR